MPSPARITCLPVYRYPNKLAPNVPKKSSFLIFCFIFNFFANAFYSSRALTIFMISFISSLEIINVVFLDPNIFLSIATSVADAAINPNGIKMLLANGSSAFSTKGNPDFSNGSRSLPKNPYDCPILCIWVFW